MLAVALRLQDAVTASILKINSNIAGETFIKRKMISGSSNSSFV